MYNINAHMVIDIKDMTDLSREEIVWRKSFLNLTDDEWGMIDEANELPSSWCVRIDMVTIGFVYSEKESEAVRHGDEPIDYSPPQANLSLMSCCGTRKSGWESEIKDAITKRCRGVYLYDYDID